ncbi:MAG TPA: nuclear transport factor 2 family protein [Gemmatimonadaceae bacterium]|jgi:ketosteroid isomerase-like protein
MKRFIAAAVILIATAAPAFADCTDAEKKALETFDHAWGDATNKGDKTAMAPFFADDYQGFVATGTQSKNAAMDAASRAADWNRANAADAPRPEYGSYSFSCTGNTATITHRTTVTARVDGKDQVFYNRSVHFLEKRNGRWQAVANAGGPLDDAGVLAYMEREWNEASRTRDRAWFERNYAFDATDISSRTGAISTKMQAANDAASDKTEFQSLDLSDLNIRVEGNSAVVTGVNHVVGRDAQGKAFDRRSRFTDTYIKRDGRWQVWATQGTTIL